MQRKPVQISTWIFATSVALTAHSQQSIKPTEKYCTKATGISQGFAESVASRLRISYKSITFISAEPMPGVGCFIRLDTPKGPATCVSSIIHSDGKDYWVGGGCL